MTEQEGTSNRNLKEFEPASTPLVSIIIPTKNEEGNITNLLDRITSSVADFNAEIIFMDESEDRTPELIGRYESSIPTHVMRRKTKKAVKGGLAHAVVAGLDRARGDYLCIMDADLQHPPEFIPTMLDTAMESDADIVIASRYVEGGSSEGLANQFRKFVSVNSRRLSRLILSEVRSVEDPGSGFFLINRRILEGAELTPYGFKILLEILIKTDWEKIEEAAFEFQKRTEGESKANLRQGLYFYWHLYRLLRYKISTRKE